MHHGNYRKNNMWSFKIWQWLNIRLNQDWEFLSCTIFLKCFSFNTQRLKSIYVAILRAFLIKIKVITWTWQMSFSTLNHHSHEIQIALRTDTLARAADSFINRVLPRQTRRVLHFYSHTDSTHWFYTYTTQIPVMVRTGRLTGSITQRDIFQHFVQPLSSFSSSASRAKSAQVELTFNWEWLTSAQLPTDSCPGAGWVVGHLQVRWYLLSFCMKAKGHRD